MIESVRDSRTPVVIRRGRVLCFQVPREMVRFPWYHDISGAVARSSHRLVQCHYLNIKPSHSQPAVVTLSHSHCHWHTMRCHHRPGLNGDWLLGSLIVLQLIMGRLGAHGMVSYLRVRLERHGLVERSVSWVGGLQWHVGLRWVYPLSVLGAAEQPRTECILSSMFYGLQVGVDGALEKTTLYSLPSASSKPI